MTPEERRRGVRTGDVEVRQLAGRRERVPAFGKTTELVQCPYCREESRVHVRSFAAVGKVCGGCGALLTEGPCYLSVEDVKGAERAVSSTEWRYDDPPVEKELLGIVRGESGVLFATVRWNGEQWSLARLTDDEEWDGEEWDGKEWIHVSSMPIWVGEADGRDDVVAWSELPALPPWVEESE